MLQLPPESSELDVKKLSKIFVDARKNQSGMDEFPGGLIPATLELGYEIQADAIKQWDDEIIGWKVGGVPPTLQEKYKQTRLAGPIFKSSLMNCEDKGHVKAPMFSDGYAAVEAEFIFKLGDISHLPNTGVTLDQAESVIEQVFLGYENASSPLKVVNDIGPIGPISDFGCNNGIVIGPELKDWKEKDILSIPVTVNINGKHINTTPAKPGLDGPFGAVKFLIEFLKKYDYNTEAGLLVSSGAITGVHQAFPGDKAEVIFGDFATLNIELACSKSC